MSDRFDPNDPLAGIEPFDGGNGPGGEPPPGGSGPTGPQPRSPLLTGMVVGLLLVIASVALFQLFSRDGEDPGGATGTTLAGGTTGAPGDSSTTRARGAHRRPPPSPPAPPEPGRAPASRTPAGETRYRSPS